MNERTKALLARAEQRESIILRVTAGDIAQSCPDIDTVIKLVSELESEAENLDECDLNEVESIVSMIGDIMEDIRRINSSLRDALYGAENVVSLKDLTIYELRDYIEEMEFEYAN